MNSKKTLFEKSRAKGVFTYMYKFILNTLPILNG